MNAITFAPRPVLVAGYSDARDRATALMSSCAPERVAPGLSRPITSYEWESRSFARPTPNPSGSHSCVRPGYASEAGATPMIVYGLPLRSSVRPRMPESAPKRVRHNVSPITATVPWP